MAPRAAERASLARGQGSLQANSPRRVRLNRFWSAVRLEAVVGPAGERCRAAREPGGRPSIGYEVQQGFGADEPPNS